MPMTTRIATARFLHGSADLQARRPCSRASASDRRCRRAFPRRRGRSTASGRGLACSARRSRIARPRCALAGALSATPSSGTLTPRSGIVNVCAAVVGSIAEKILPLIVISSLTVPLHQTRSTGCAGRSPVLLVDGHVHDRPGGNMEVCRRQVPDPVGMLVVPVSLGADGGHGGQREVDHRPALQGRRRGRRDDRAAARD